LRVWLAIHWQAHARPTGCQEAAVIYKRGKRWRVIVYAGRDPITGRKRQKSVSVATGAEAKQAEARLITEVGAGQQRATSNRTVAGLLELGDRLAEAGRPLRPRTIQTALGELEAAGLARGSDEGNGRARYWSPAPPDDGLGGGAGTP
jgi:Arm DNA-binding domain